MDSLSLQSFAIPSLRMVSHALVCRHMAEETFHHFHVLTKLDSLVADRHVWPKKAARVACSNRCHEYSVAKVRDACERRHGSERCTRAMETRKGKAC